MVMKKLQRKFVVILNQNTEVKKMFKFNCSKKILQLELTIEHQQRQMDELRSLVLHLSTELEKITTQLERVTKEKYGKSI
mgnify:CR=1 FL=1